MMRLAIIPARGGSKRIPGKNIKDFYGRPILSYVIEVAEGSNLFDEIIVSTDDNEIALVAKKFNASVPFMRSKSNADDYATLSDVILEVIDSYKKIGKEFDCICCILPTAALITREKIIASYNKMENFKLSGVIPILKYSYPIQRALIINNGLIKMKEIENMNSRSQDLEAYYHDSGQFYWVKVGHIMDERKLFMQNTGYIELKEYEAQDVDTIEDWKILEFKYKYNRSVKN